VEDEGTPAHCCVGPPKLLHFSPDRMQRLFPLVTLGLVAGLYLSVPPEPARGSPSAWTCGEQGSKAGQASTTPEPQADTGRWKERFDAQLAWLGSHQPKYIFLGDSITEWWPESLWREAFPSGTAAKLGIARDKTQNLIFRLERGQALPGPGLVFVVLIGTNNIGHGDTPEDTADGIRRVVQTIRAANEDAAIVLLGIMPRARRADDRLRLAVNRTNALIRSCAAALTGVRYADLGRLLLESDGSLSEEVSPDALHLSEEGYRRILPRLTALLREAGEK
jgi:lysophospholipase L1-like esterase